jgi:ribosomal protein S18 acetylase RimI-like enzyme
MNLLKPMSSQEYNTYIKNKIERYATTLLENTYEATNESSYLRAEKAINGYLPDGFNTKHHEFYMISDLNEVVGHVWIKIDEQKKSAFLYEIFLVEAARSKGIGKRAMVELENVLKKRKVEFFKLHVFGSNEPAIHLYNNLGFEIAGINMYKVISKF